MDLTTLAEQAESLDALKKYSAAQFRTIQDLKLANEKLAKEVTHLKHLLTQTTSLISEPAIDRIEVSREQAMCEIQIKRMEETAKEREFTLEETRRFEILVKTLYLIKTGGGDAIQPDFSRIADTVTVEQLEAIASIPETSHE